MYVEPHHCHLYTTPHHKIIYCDYTIHTKMTFLRNLANEAGNTTKKAVADRQDRAKAPSPGVKKDLLETVVETLTGFHDNLTKPTAGSTIELEVRMGLIPYLYDIGKGRSTHSIPGEGAITVPGTGFLSGVSPPDYATISKQIESFSTNRETTVEEVYSYTDSSIRVVYDTVSKRFKSESKEKFYPVDLQIPAAAYDLRIQSSLETNLGSVSNPPDNWKNKRTKRRVSWESSEMWRSDLTLVETETRPGVEEKPPTWEVELELLPKKTKEWISTSDPEKMTSDIAKDLLLVLEKINPMEMESSIDEIIEEKDGKIKSEVKKALGNIKTTKSGDFSFPGAQPVNMLRRDIEYIQTKPYYVAEKTDGVRYLMVVLGETCVLVKRSKYLKIFKVDGGHEIANVLPTGTILDGELVHNRTSGKSVFLVFDMLQNAKRKIIHENFSERYYGELTSLMNEFRNKKGHLQLAMKVFHKREDLGEVFRNIHTGKHRIYKSGLLHHKTDGIIFQPDTPYVTQTDKTLFKWKWVDLASIDLKVHSGNSEKDLKFCSDAGDGVEVDLSKSIHLSAQDTARLVGDMAYDKSKTKKTWAIAEVALSPGSGLWVYMGLRTDKDSSNFIGVVMSTMLEVAEGLDEDELKYRMAATDHSSDDWDVQENAMRKKAVQYQYKKQNKKQRTS